jgi:sugar diacid utilization regulator
MMYHESSGLTTKRKESAVEEWVTITEASNRLGIHRNTMRMRIKLWDLRTKRNPLNLSERLVDWRQIKQRLQEFEETEGKADALSGPGRQGSTPMAA